LGNEFGSKGGQNQGFGEKIERILERETGKSKFLYWCSSPGELDLAMARC